MLQQSGFGGQHLLDPLHILLGILGVALALQAVLRQVPLADGAAPQGQDGAELLHHIDVVEAQIPVPAPAHVFQAAGHVLLPVEVVGGVAPAAEPLVGVVHHGLHRRLAGQTLPAGEELRPLFQGQGVDGDVGGIQGQDPVQGAGKALRVVPGQARDEIHVDALKTRLPGLGEGPLHVRGGVGAAHRPQHGVVHALGVDADPVRPQRPDDPELFRVHGVGPPGLHRIFYQPAPVKMPVDGLHHGL